MKPKVIFTIVSTLLLLLSCTPATQQAINKKQAANLISEPKKTIAAKESTAATDRGLGDTLSPKHEEPENIFQHGLVLFTQKQYQKALEQFKTIDERYTGFRNSRDVKKYIALCYLKTFDYHNAILWYKKLFQAHTEARSDSVSIFNMGNAYYGIGDYANAKKSYLQIWGRTEMKAKTAEVTLKLGLCAFYMLDYVAAQHYLQRALPLEQKQEELAKIIFILGRIYADQDDYLKSFDFFMRTIKTIDNNNLLKLGETKASAKRRVTAIIENKLTGSQLESIYHEYVPQFPSNVALYKYIDYLYKKGAYKKALSEIENFSRLFPDSEHSSAILFIKSKIDSYAKPQKSVKVGAIIPMTGKLSIYGERVLRGIQLAAEEINAQSERKIAIIPKDDKGQALNTRKAYRELASLPDIVAIIGPVLSGGVLAIKDLIDEYQVPIITPSASKDGIPGMSNMIFRNCITNAEQGRFIAKFAVEKLCLKTFAVMYPENKFGTQLKEVFTKTINRYGGEVIFFTSYKDNETDFKKQCRTVNRVKPQSIFIADYAEKAVLILPQLEFYTKKAREYTILGTRGWYRQKLIKEGGRFVKNVFFPSGFFKESKDLNVVEFYQDFIAHFSEEPDDLAAQAFDTTNILFHAIKNSDFTKESVVEELYKIKDFPGVSGFSSIQADGDSQKRLKVLTVRKKRFVEVGEKDPALCDKAINARPQMLGNM